MDESSLIHHKVGINSSDLALSFVVLSLPCEFSISVHISKGGCKYAAQNSYVSESNQGNALVPPHTYKTEYKYNSYNQLVSTTNPDQEGETKFWYDFYGRIAASQNPVQADVNMYSYSFYDAQGRPVEVGQVVQTTVPSPSILELNDLGTAFKNWVLTGTRSEVTLTKYDRPKSVAIAAKFANGKQENLRLRVASVFYYPIIQGGLNWQDYYETATHYSYDIHGNVKEMLQDVPMLAPVEQDVKSTQYDYELISGNVKEVHYQEGEADQMTHKYEYDKLNRITEVFTSTDQVHESRQAHYRYYDYGPLARVEKGQYKVQGEDYAYTINGWLKGMNASTIDKYREMGKDGTKGYLTNNSQVHSLFAKDVLAYTIGYYENDYKPISANSFEIAYGTSDLNTNARNLYNGNIRSLVTSIVGMQTMGNAYHYDQLQRLKEMTAYYFDNNPAYSWDGIIATQDYYNNYTYDKNGNILTLQRNGNIAGNLFMDNFTYNYIGLDGLPNASSASKSNRLKYVVDNGTDDNDYTDDIKAGMASNNYKYDKIGQLTGDVSEGISTIEWRKGDKKISKLIRSTADLNSSQVEFVYNPFGIRVLKIEKPRVGGVIQGQDQWEYSYYSYDANGQVMAVYEVQMSASLNKATVDEHHLYGTSRLGMKKSGILLYDNGPVSNPPQDVYQNTLGLTSYEITNYLGNVNAVITDRKIWNAIDQNFEAVVTMTADYYPGGMVEPGRNTNFGSYKFAYNSMEMDNEVSGNGNSYTTEFRQYDPRLGRWKSLDPLMKQFPWMSPFVAFDNNPIYYTDPLGLASEGGPGDDEPRTINGTDDKPKQHGWIRIKGEGLIKVKIGDKYITPNGDNYVYKGDDKKYGERWELEYKTLELEEVTVTAKYSDRKTPTEFYTDTRHSIAEAPIHRMIPGDVIKQSLYDPYGVDYTNGILPDYREYTYLGNGQFELTKRFKNEETADLVVEGAMYAIPIGRVFKIAGGVIKLLPKSKFVWNLGESVITKSHHNWAKMFGSKVITLQDAEKIIRKAVSRGEFVATGEIIHGKGGVAIGEKMMLNEVVNGQKVWVTGTKMYSTGKIVINNGGIK